MELKFDVYLNVFTKRIDGKLSHDFNYLKPHMMPYKYPYFIINSQLICLGSPTNMYHKNVN